ncbi:GIY-YIG nuclease family protein [Parvularcula maris]|uniref:GIY-YIG nuclease family protein n=1 Tax=Parvularcula maris TaxID=2965077 RepID=A0A9X2L9X4_9PROT|nr:GIY-YIG nuclease family protein [Parvularcula maris]MCQ8185651.1 GIY-YIG nuclease family protein [Parvularcula maris]
MQTDSVRPCFLTDLWSPADPTSYKVHFARWNAQNQPLHVLARSFEEWRGWQEFYPGKNDFNRVRIFSLAQVLSAKDRWVFGGIWQVEGQGERQDGTPFYRVRLADELRSLYARLKVRHVHKSRGTRLNLENHLRDMVISEILPEPYTGRPFPGYDSVNLSFQEIEGLMANSRRDWATALRHVKGVYLITHTGRSQRYVGSAYGETGIWSRWAQYIQTGHGGNLELRRLVRQEGIEECRQHFRFTLLEHLPARTEDSVVIARENYWKEVLNTRDVEAGLNRN